MRQSHGAAVAAAVTLLALSAPAFADGGGHSQPPAVATSPDDGWKGVVYPVYGWLPIYRADVRFPDAPEGSSDASLDQAFLAAFRVEKGRFALEVGFLYAGLSGEAERPDLRIEVDTRIADLRAGFAVAPDLFLEGGARYLALETKTTIADNPTVDWKPDLLEPVIGFTYRPLLGKKWRLVLHGDVGGVVTGDSTTATASAKLEWQPAKHFLLVLGGTVQYLSIEGTIGSKSAKLDQTLYGPIVGFGVPF